MQVSGRHQHVVGVTSGLVYAGDLHDDETHTAFRTRLLIHHNHWSVTNPFSAMTVSCPDDTIRFESVTLPTLKGLNRFGNCVSLNLRLLSSTAKPCGASTRSGAPCPPRKPGFLSPRHAASPCKGVPVAHEHQESRSGEPGSSSRPPLRGCDVDRDPRCLGSSEAQ